MRYKQYSEDDKIELAAQEIQDVQRKISKLLELLNHKGVLSEDDIIDVEA